MSRIEDTGRGLGNEGAALSLLFGVLGSLTGRGATSISSSSSSILLVSAGSGVGGVGKSHGRGTRAAGMILWMDGRSGMSLLVKREGY